MSICRIGMLTIYSIVIGAARGPDESARTPEEWTTPGTEWRLHVKQYRGYGPQLASKNPRDLAKMEEAARSVQDDFEMIITVLEPQTIKGQQIARFRFTPAEDAAPYIKEGEYILEVNVDTGQARRLISALRQEENGAWIEGEGERILSEEWVTMWFPINWIIRASDLVSVPAAQVDRTLRTTNKRDINKRLEAVDVADGKKGIRIEVTNSVPGNRAKIVQVWVPGEPWWRSFQRYCGDLLMLEAEFIEGSLSQPGSAGPSH